MTDWFLSDCQGVSSSWEIIINNEKKREEHMASVTEDQESALERPVALVPEGVTRLLLENLFQRSWDRIEQDHGCNLKAAQLWTVTPEIWIEYERELRQKGHTGRGSGESLRKVSSRAVG